MLDDDDGGEGEGGGPTPVSKYILPGDPISGTLCISANVRSFVSSSKQDELMKLISKYPNTAVICLQELWDLVGPYPIIPGFQPLVCKTRQGKGGGGVGIYVRENIDFKTISSPFLESKLETIAIDLYLNKHKMTRLINLYIPPGVKLEDTLSHLDLLPVKKNNCFLVGDFNLNQYN